MAIAIKKFQRHRKGKKVHRRGPTKGRVTTGKVEKICKQMIARNVENKTKSYTPSILQPLGGEAYTSFASTIIPVSPYPGYISIQQGTGQGERIGNRIKIKYASIKGTIFAYRYDLTVNPVPQPSLVYMWIFYDRSDPSVLPDPQADFYQNGNSTAAMSGDLRDGSQYINTDRYRVLTKRTFKIGYSQNTGTGTTPAQANFSNNDYKLTQNFNINLTKYLVKNVKYIDNNTTPTTRGLYCMIECVPANGTSYGSATTPCQYFYTIRCDYEDA